MKKYPSLYIFIAIILLSSCSTNIQSSFSSSLTSIDQVSSYPTTSSNVYEEDDSIIEKAPNYLPEKVISPYHIAKEKNGKCYAYTDYSGDVFGEIALNGLEYDIVRKYKGHTFSTKDCKENKYFLERGEEYFIIVYLTSFDSDANRTVLHQMNLDLFTCSRFELSENITLYNENWITPASLGKAIIKISFLGFSYEAIIQVVEKDSRKKESYSISFKTDERFLGSSMKSPSFKEGDKITFTRWDKADARDGVSCEVISINGFEYDKTETYFLPPMDIIVEYYNYERIPDFVSYVSWKELE